MSHTSALECDGHGDGARIRSAAAQCCDAVSLGLDALKAGDDRHLALSKRASNLAARHAGDARRAVRRVGVDRDLPALPGARLQTHRLQHDGKQARGHLFTGGDDGIVLAHVMQHGGLAHPGDELVGHAGHGRDHDGDLVAGIDLALHVTRDIRMRSMLATDVPPNFMTTVAIVVVLSRA